ncbi:hypothetical protein J3R74_003533 [Puniceicoccus vermicola]
MEEICSSPFLLAKTEANALLSVIFNQVKYLVKIWKQVWGVEENVCR